MDINVRIDLNCRQFSLIVLYTLSKLKKSRWLFYHLTLPEKRWVVSKSCANSPSGFMVFC